MSTIKNFFALALLAVSFAQAAYAQVGDEPRRRSKRSNDTESTSKTITQENRDVKDFTSIDFGGIGKAVIQKGDKFACTVVVSGKADRTADISTEVKDKVLVINTRIRNWHGDNTDVQYTITMPELEAVEVSGAVKAEIKEGFAPKKLTLSISGAGALTGNVAAGTVQTNVSGTGKITLTGSATEMQGSISGTGKVDAQNMPAKRANINVSGVGSFYVNATDDLTASVSGTGSVK
jgi:hypothetical protein